MEKMQQIVKRALEQDLERQRVAREADAREARLETYERDMIARCNDNNANAKQLRLLSEAERINQEQLAQQRKAQREQLQREWERENAAADAVRYYVMFCMALLLVTVWTPLPWWAAAALIAGTAACLAAYVFRIFCPEEEANEAPIHRENRARG